MGGELDPDGVFADETVTFSVAKPVHLLPPTEQACGLLTVVDIGVELDDEPVVRRLDHDDVAAPLAGARRRPTTSTPAGCSASSPAARPTRAQPC